MKATLAVLALCVAVATAMPLADTSSFESWMSFHSKNYENDSEGMLRRAIFETNKKYVIQHNEEYALGKHTYYLGLNHFADLSQEEFAELYLSKYVRNSTGSTYLMASHVDLPTEVDWRKEGYVTPVKNQGQCGSCWSFSATGSLEGQHFKKTGKLVSLSEQNLVDCAGSFGNMGCNGGLMDNAYEYIKSNGGIDTEASYPYTAQDGSCHYSASNVGATVSGHTDVPQGDEAALTNAVATVGPIAVAIDASHMSFQMYSGGVYNEPSCSTSQLDHGVLVVGYGVDSGTDFFWVKNSWGPSWGLSGYIKMSRNGQNQCGIASSAVYPLLA